MHNSIRWVILMATVAGGVPAAAQQEPSADSLVAHWLKHGVAGGWGPGHLLLGCPNLKPWQQRGIELVLAADLDEDLRKDLARRWAGALRCQDPRVEQWFFDQVNRDIQSGKTVDAMLVIWGAIDRGDSPRTREFLWNLMLDPSVPESQRGAAGGVLFTKFGPEERLREFLRVFETGRMPSGVFNSQPWMLLKQDANRLLREVSQRVRTNPELADQPAFTAIAESSVRFATPAARRALGEALREGLGRSGIAGVRRTRLDETVDFLIRPPRP